MGKKYIIDTEQKLSNKGFKKARIAKAGSILVTCIASIGKNAITKIDCGFNQQINAISPNSNFDSDFIFYLIEFNTNVLLSFAGAGAMPMLNKGTFVKIKLTIPTFLEQQKIASVLSAADKEIALLRQELTNLTDQKKGLMQKLLTGEVRVKMN
jgi:type I restriction enzyme S subunit